MEKRKQARKRLREILIATIGIEAAANKLGIARETLSRKLNGTDGDFTETQLIILSELTGLSLNEIVYGERLPLNASINELVKVAEAMPPEFPELVISLVESIKR